MTTKWQEKSLGANGNIQYLYCGDGYVTVCICQTHGNVHYSECILLYAYTCCK